MAGLAIPSTYLVAVIAIVLAPGPGQALVLARSISGGRKAGILTSLGLNTGTMIHAMAAGVGLSAILVTSALAFSLVKLLGAAYLIYLGVRAILAKHTTIKIEEKVVLSPHKAFVQSMMTGILNPKVALFFLAFLPQFVDPARGMTLLQFMVLGGILAMISILWDCVLASIVGILGDRMAHSESFAWWRQRVMGFMFVGLGIQLAFARHK